MSRPTADKRSFTHTHTHTHAHTMNEHLAHHLAFHRLYYAALKGATITAAGVELGEDEHGTGNDCWPTITATLANGDKVKLEVSQDEEGNGPGFLFGLPMPTQEETKEKAKLILVGIKAVKEREEKANA